MEQEISETPVKTESSKVSSSVPPEAVITADVSSDMEDVILEEVFGLSVSDGELDTDNKDALRSAISSAAVAASDIEELQEADPKIEPVQPAAPVGTIDDSLIASSRVKAVLPGDVTALLAAGSSFDLDKSPVGAINATLNYTQPGDPVTIDLQRKLSLDPNAPIERVRLLLDIAPTSHGNDPHALFVQKQFTKSVHEIASKLERIIAQGHADLGKSQEIANFGAALVELLKPDKAPKNQPVLKFQLQEISAQNSRLFFGTKGSQEHMLDGVTWRDCNDLTVSAERSLAHETRGRFGVNAHGMKIIGGSGSLTYKGIDCSEVEIQGLGEGAVKWLQFIQCQLRGARVVDDCAIHTLNLKDSFLSEGADLSRLQLTNPPLNDTEFKALFNGLAWMPHGIQALSAFGAWV